MAETKFQEILNVDDYIKKAKDLEKEGDVEGALKCFDECIKLDPEELEIYMEKADFYFDLGENEKALECYDIIYEKLEKSD